MSGWGRALGRDFGLGGLGLPCELPCSPCPLPTSAPQLPKWENRAVKTHFEGHRAGLEMGEKEGEGGRGEASPPPEDQGAQSPGGHSE